MNLSSATAETPIVDPRHALPLDPHRISFRAGSATPAAVNAEAGTISRVSLITADREAGGHGVWIDARTLETFSALLEKRRFKAYATHGWGDGTLNEVGYWENVAIDGKNLRADFSALTAWKTHHRDEFDTLFELAAKMPAEFGASLSFRFQLAWVAADARETPTVRKYRYSSDRGYEAYFDPVAPTGALRASPSVRAIEVYSADFVDVPAANTGLFSAAPEPRILPGDVRVKTRAAFESMTPRERMAFMKSGGTLTDSTPQPSRPRTGAVVVLARPGKPPDATRNVKSRAEFEKLQPKQKSAFFKSGGVLA